MLTLLSIAFVVGFSLSSSFKFPYELNQSSNLILNYDIKINEEDHEHNFATENQKNENLNDIDKLSNETTSDEYTDITSEDIEKNANSILPESDGAEVKITSFSIYQMDEEIVSNKTIPNIDISKGCLVDEILNDEKIWYSPDRLENYTKRFFNISIQVEYGLNLNPNCLGEMVIGILNDPRGWATIENQLFQIVDREDADLNIIFAKPETVDELCYPLQTNGIYSCRNEKNVVINMFRWVSGAKDFDNDLSTYRIYLINHEVGHYLGWGHSDCPSENALAPVMMQQSKTTDGCIPNGWPIYERVKLLYRSP